MSNRPTNIAAQMPPPQGSVISSQEFSLLFARWHDPFVNIAASYIHDRPAAEDIVADCFTRFWDKREELRLTSLPEAYLLTSVKNRCLNYLRDMATRMRISQNMQEDSYRAILTEIDILDGQEMALLFREDVQRIFAEFMKTLPPLTRNIFYSSRFEDLTYDEIADKYGVSSRKVKREIQKVLELMRASLKDYLPIAGLLLSLYLELYL